MGITHAELIGAGYAVQAAPPDDWRVYDERDPVPGYFQFDWLSSRHPDLYHQFALSTDGLMRELQGLVDLTGLSVVDVGAGTGRSTMAAATRAKRVTAIDVFPSVLVFGKEQSRQLGLRNVQYARGHHTRLPLRNSAFDALVNSWAELNYAEAYRVLRPGGYLVQLGAPLDALCGELTALLAPVYPTIIAGVAPARLFEPGCPAADAVLQDDTWNGLPVIPPVLQHDFTHVVDYGDCREAAAILGRLYGPAARRYVVEREQSTLAWRLRIVVARIRK